MTDAIDFERQLDDWFAGEAPGRAPDRVLASTMERVGTIGQRRSIRSRLRSGSRQTTWQRGLALAMIVLATVLAALLVAGALRRDPPVISPRAELVVLRGDSVVAIAPDGTERELAVLSADVLGGTIVPVPGAVLSSDGYLAVPVSLDDNTISLRLVDLRSPTAPARELDVAGDAPAFGPDGRLGMASVDGMAWYDPATGESGSTDLPALDGNPKYVPVTMSGRVEWTATGSGVVAQTFDGEAMTGVLAPDGRFTAVRVPPFDDGLGPRVVRADGAILRCRPDITETCSGDGTGVWAVEADAVRPIWTLTEAGIRLIDASWAADGGLWLLLETSADGPRTVYLAKVQLGGATETIASFQAPADDPDPNSYFAGGRLTAVAQNDELIVVTISSSDGVGDASWSVTTSGGRSAVDGEVVGWLMPSAFERPRPSATARVPTDAAIRGIWTDGRATLRVGPNRLTVDESDTLDIDRGGPDLVTIEGSTRTVTCGADQIGTYRWAVDGARLTLESIDDRCSERAAALAGTYDPSLPIQDDGPPVVPPGGRYRSSIVGVPIGLVMPDSGGASIERHVAQDLSMIGPVVDGGIPLGTVVVSVCVPAGGLDDPCARRGTNLLALGPGREGIADYVGGLADRGIARSAVTQTTFAGLDALTFTVEITNPDCTGVLFRADSNSGYGSVGRTARLTVVEHPNGRVVVIVQGQWDDATPAAVAWADELVASISFEPLE